MKLCHFDSRIFVVPEPGSKWWWRFYRVLANVLLLDLALSVATILLPGTVVIAAFMLDLEIANEITRLLLH